MDHGDHFLYKVYIIYVYVPLDLLGFQIYFKYILGLETFNFNIPVSIFFTIDNEQNEC
jgi:hypothetical protein